MIYTLTALALTVSADEDSVETWETCNSQTGILDATINTCSPAACEDGETYVPATESEKAKCQSRVERETWETCNAQTGILDYTINTCSPAACEDGETYVPATESEKARCESAAEPDAPVVETWKSCNIETGILDGTTCTDVHSCRKGKTEEGKTYVPAKNAAAICDIVHF